MLYSGHLSLREETFFASRIKMAFNTQKAFQSGNVAVQSFYISKVMVKLKYTKDQSIPLLPQCSKGHFESNFILAYFDHMGCFYNIYGLNSI